ncbi:MAG: hypothetical protein WCJ95_17440, partial [Mariniphaga sp.]
MKTSPRIAIPLLPTLFSLCALAFAGCTFAQSPKSTLKKIAVIELTGEKGKRFDYLTIDYKHKYLFSAHLGADKTYIIDLKSNKLIKTINDTHGVEG